LLRPPPYKRALYLQGAFGIDACSFLETPRARIPLLSSRLRLSLSHARFRRGLRLALTCLAMALAGAGAMGISSAPKLIPAVPPDQASTAETNPTTTPTPYAAVDLRPAMAKGAQIVVAGRPSCVADTRPEGNCVSVKLREPRMVWVGNDRSAIAAIALARRAPPTTGINDAVLPAA